ncbi:MAG: hypothetical protein HRT35_21070 [Algicola sp.]|nr:hypothetical protein [Algicola sp.]
MSKPKFKMFPCIFCTVGYNTYVAGHKLVCGTYDRLSGQSNKPAATQLAIESPKQKATVINANDAVDSS